MLWLCYLLIQLYVFNYSLHLQVALSKMKGGFSVADLQKAQKKLNSVPDPAAAADSKSSSSAPPAPDSKALNSLEELYDKHGGDLDLMCVVLNNCMHMTTLFYSMTSLPLPPPPPTPIT